ncbi:MAG: phenylalanine--tRNA ligase subunit beta [Nanobdellota archaeon]
MPTVKLNKKVIMDKLGKKYTDEELSEIISSIGTDLESIDENEISVEIFPNRPDMLSEQGLGRALSSYVGKDTGIRKYKVQESGKNLVVKKSAKNVRPNTSCAIVKNLQFDDEKIKEIVQIQEKLHITYGRNRKKCAIGIYPLEKIKFPVQFEGKDPSEIKFLPLEGKKEMTGIQILNQHPAGREYGNLLEDKKMFPFFIDSNNKILSMPPIINSEETGRINYDTKEVFIECSGFDQKVTDLCLNMIVTAMADMGGNIYSINLKNEVENWEKKSPELQPREMDIDIDYVNKILGTTFTGSNIKKLLEKMGFGVSEKKVLVPCYRTDILHQADLIEDIAIAYGYNNFEKSTTDFANIGKKSSKQKLKVKMTEILVGLGYLETNTFCLLGHEDIYEKYLSQEKSVKLANSVNKDYNLLRNSVLPSLMITLNNNKSNEYPLGFFETGIIFYPDENKNTKIGEKMKTAFVYADADADFNNARQVIDYLMNKLDLDYKVETAKDPSFMEGRTAKIVSGNKEIGILGQINPQVIENFNLTVPVSAFEIDFEQIYKLIDNK